MKLNKWDMVIHKFFGLCRVIDSGKTKTIIIRQDNLKQCIASTKLLSVIKINKDEQERDNS